MKKIISTDNAPSAIGPYSQAVVAGNMLFTSGQIAIDPKTGALKMDTVEQETEQVMNNLSAVLSEAGATFENVIKTSIFLKNMDDFNTVNEIYASFFEADYPARETVQVAKLPKDVNVEISMIALL
jgi:2-iminobutanoate/2-iminopropanoate deaminase